jgi:hypothetical protein
MWTRSDPFPGATLAIAHVVGNYRECFWLCDERALDRMSGLTETARALSAWHLEPEATAAVWLLAAAFEAGRCRDWRGNDWNAVGLVTDAARSLLGDRAPDYHWATKHTLPRDLPERSPREPQDFISAVQILRATIIRMWRVQIVHAEGDISLLTLRTRAA